jgi:spore coat protein JC
LPANRKRHFDTSQGTEELAHVEIIATMVYRLVKDATVEELKSVGLGGHYAQHDRALYWTDANGVPWTAAYIQATGDPITDLHEDMAAEQKARTTYEHLIHLTDDPGIIDTLRFLREREVVHFQRFGEALNQVQEHLEKKKYY